MLVEALRPLPETGFLQSKEPSARVGGFLKENPNPTFRDRLNFLRSEFPQRTGRNINWILEGGTAVALYCPHLHREIRDLDIVFRTQSMASEFTKTLPHFHARSIDYWLIKRGFKATQKNIDYVLWSNVPLHVENAELLTMAPAILTASKIHLYNRLPPRPQDLIDVANLGIPLEKAYGVIQKLAA